MTDFITVEPARDLAGNFAAWCIKQDPNILTVSGGGFLVRLDLYPDIPAALLSGAYVDGYLYGQASPQPVATKPADANPATRKRAPRKTAENKTKADTE